MSAHRPITGSGGFTVADSTEERGARLIFSPDGVCLGTVVESDPVRPIQGRPASRGYVVRRGSIDLGVEATLLDAARRLCRP